MSFFCNLDESVPNPEMCTFGVLGLSCASPGGPARPSETPPKFNEKTPRDTERAKAVTAFGQT